METKTREKSLDDMSPEEAVDTIIREGGKDALAFATMIIGFKAMNATEDGDMRTDIANNLYSFLKGAAIESLLLSTVQKCTQDKKFRETIDEHPVQAMVIMGMTANKEKTKIAEVLHNLCEQALDCDKKKDT
jgi:hypothetical protein